MKYQPVLWVTVLLGALVASNPALAEKQGGVLRVYHRDSPASMSILEEASISTVVPVMGVFNPNTSPPTRGRAHAREAAGNQRPRPADKVERWAIDRLIPYAKNARTHSDAQIAAIAASIKEWGWTTPALVGEDGGLIAGHARMLAARQLGIAEIPVMVAAGWSEAQKGLCPGRQSAGDHRVGPGPGIAAARTRGIELGRL
jgi:hypothetical protein